MRNNWGGEIELQDLNSITEEENPRNMDWDRASISHPENRRVLDETQQGWLLGPSEDRKRKKHIDLGCVVCSQKAFKWTVGLVVSAFVVMVLPIILSKTLPKHKTPPPPLSNYGSALNVSLHFFDAQKSGKLPKNFSVSWRGDSGLKDGTDVVPSGLIGGYYDAGDNTKFHFPMSYAMTMLSWSAIEYETKYRHIKQYDRVRELIKWGADYLLLTFNSSASRIDRIYSQVGGSMNGSHTPDDHYCWQRPEDMAYPRKVQTTTSSGADLAGEMAAALAAASIVFRDDRGYSKKLVKGAEAVFSFARQRGNMRTYSGTNPFIAPYYNSTGFYDEYIWGSAWLYYATGKASYLSLATDADVSKKAKALVNIPDLSVMSWDNKLPGAMLLLTRARLFLNPGYPYEDMLSRYHDRIGLTMCSYMKAYNVFNYTKGGLIQLSHGRPQNLQYVANAAFLGSLFADYLQATGIPGWNCGPTFFPDSVLKDFATSQVNYILGDNPMQISYLVGHGPKYPQHVHHRGASIPRDAKPSCTGGYKWRDATSPNPNTIDGAMVGGPDRFDKFKDIRSDYKYTEPSLAGNAGLAAALVSLASDGGFGIDKNTMFSAVLPVSSPSPPPPAPWTP